jgi:hypothetical protein
MALPQNPQGISNTEKQLLEAIRNQNTDISAQTKILHKISDRALEHRKESTFLRKEMQELRKDLAGANKGSSEIKKYFERTRDPRMSKKSTDVDKDKDKESKGFFRTALGKLFGPSKYQQKMMDDTSAIRDISESTQEDINYIKTRYEEPARAKERELLAQAIADKINDANDSGGGKSGKGLLGGALAALGAVLSGGLDLLYKGLKTALFSVMGGIVTGIIAGLATVLGKVWDILKSIFDELRFLGGSPSANRGPNAPMPEGPSRTDKPPTPGGPTPSGPAQKELPNGQGRLPGPNNPRLPGPSGSRFPNATDIEYRDISSNKSGAGGQSSGFRNKLLRGAGQALMSAGEFMGGINKNGALLLLAGGGALIYAGTEYVNKLKEDAAATLEQERENAGKPGYDEAGRKIIPEEKSLLAQAQDAAKIAIDKTMETTKDLVGGVSERLKEQLVRLAGLEDDVIEMAGSLANYSKDYLNKVGEIQFTTGDGSKQSLNLLPGLGTYTIGALTKAIEQTNELAQMTEDYVKKNAVSIINSTTNNVMKGNDAPAILPPASPVNRYDSVDRFLMEMGRIK